MTPLRGDAVPRAVDVLVDGTEAIAARSTSGIAPFKTADGAQAGWIIVLEDVTDRANLEEQLRLSEKMAAIGLLAAGVAHEVNTPLTGISSFTQMLLERSEPGDPDRQLLEKIERQTFRAAKIVNSLLNLARPSDGEAAPIDINAVIGDVLSLLEHQFKTGRIQVRRELQGGGVIVRGVEYKLQQVFLNLFLNARDAMQKGGWLAVSSRVRGRDGDRRAVRHGRRHSRRAPGAHLRSVLHDEGRRPRHGSWVVRHLRHRPGTRWHADVRQHAGTRHPVPPRPAGRGAARDRRGGAVVSSKL